MEANAFKEELALANTFHHEHEEPHDSVDGGVIVMGGRRSATVRRLPRGPNY